MAAANVSEQRIIYSVTVTIEMTINEISIIGIRYQHVDCMTHDRNQSKLKLMFSMTLLPSTRSHAESSLPGSCLTDQNPRLDLATSRAFNLFHLAGCISYFFVTPHLVNSYRSPQRTEMPSQLSSDQQRVIICSLFYL